MENWRYWRFQSSEISAKENYKLMVEPVKEKERERDAMGKRRWNGRPILTLWNWRSRYWTWSWDLVFPLLGSCLTLFQAFLTICPFFRMLMHILCICILDANIRFLTLQGVELKGLSWVSEETFYFWTLLKLLRTKRTFEVGLRMLCVMKWPWAYEGGMW